MNRDEMPVGFGMALAMFPNAMQEFEMMDEKRKREIVEGAQSIRSKEEMRRYVEAVVYENRRTDLL